MTYSKSYLDGIVEGRAFKKAFPDTCPKHEYELMRELVKNFSGDMKEFLKGQRDFWLNQIKVKNNA